MFLANEQLGLNGEIGQSPKDGAQVWSFGEFAVLAHWFFFACSLARWTVWLAICCCQRRDWSPRQPGRVIEAGVSGAAEAMAKGQGKRRRASPGYFSTEIGFGAKVNQHDPREENSLGKLEQFARGQVSTVTHPGGDGAKSSTSSSRLTRNAPPWWSGTGPYATTWRPATGSTVRMMGVLNVGVGDPLN